MRTEKEQADFRESLFKEHYELFARAIFCHGSLEGIDNRYPRTQKVEAHHIYQYAKFSDCNWVHDRDNGILLSIPLHSLIHQEYYRREQQEPVSLITRELITRNFWACYEKAKNIKLYNVRRAFLDIWSDELIGKRLLLGEGAF